MKIHTNENYFAWFWIKIIIPQNILVWKINLKKKKEFSKFQAIEQLKEGPADVLARVGFFLVDQATNSVAQHNGWNLVNDLIRLVYGFSLLFFKISIFQLQMAVDEYGHAVRDTESGAACH